MKILFIISSLGLGGEQRVASILTDELIKRGNDIEILAFASSKSSFKINEKIKVILSKNENKKFKLIRRVFEIRDMINLNSYDIVLSFAVIPSVLSGFAVIFKHIPLIVCERNDPNIYPLSWKIVRAISYLFAKGAVFQTEDASQYFPKFYFRFRTVIQNPLDSSKIPVLESIERGNYIVNTSRFVKAKNHKLIVDAFFKIHNEYPDLRLVFYGDGPLKELLVSYVDNKGLNDKVQFYPASSDVLNKIKNARIFVLSSNHEGFPNALAEAMAMGIPSISTDCRIGGPKSMIKSGENGILIPVNDVDLMADAIATLMDDDDMFIKLSENGKKIIRNLDIKTIGDRWVKFILLILSNQNKEVL